MHTAEINLSGNVGHEIDTAVRALALYAMIQQETGREQREYLRLQIDHLGIWIVADDCVPEMIQDCVAVFSDDALAAGLEVRVHLHIYEDNTLEQLASAK